MSTHFPQLGYGGDRVKSDPYGSTVSRFEGKEESIDSGDKQRDLEWLKRVLALV
jgi:hypothetical protein